MDCVSESCNDRGRPYESPSNGTSGSRFRSEEGTYSTSPMPCYTQLLRIRWNRLLRESFVTLPTVIDTIGPLSFS